MKKKGFVKSAVINAFVLLLGIGISAGCSQNTFVKDSKVPQIIVNPGSIHLSVAAVAKKTFVFEGTGFKPGDSILVEMLDVQSDQGKKDIAIANGEVDKDGTFKAEIGIVTKISEFIRAKIDAINNIIIVYREPIAAGEYNIRASSLMSDTTANCVLIVEEASLTDRIKDWLGVKLGKIEIKTPEEVAKME